MSLSEHQSFLFPPTEVVQDSGGAGTSVGGAVRPRQPSRASECALDLQLRGVWPECVRLAHEEAMVGAAGGGEVVQVLEALSYIHGWRGRR